MRPERLTLYCQLKEEQKRIEDALETLREEIIAAYATDAELKLPDYTLKIIYQEKKVYDDQQVFAALPDPELWKAVCRADPTKINALVKSKLLPEQLLEGTYRTTRTAYLYVQP
ncbi:hypothetical protein [Cohnella yongneupensis]|uniref:Uncharacterized protein n=1 Tax=Cohnella yongneupensis TaxID=425006 RepID=A0ABW0R1M2_9BACL